MPAAIYQSSTSGRRRAGVIALALAIELLIALVLMTLGAFDPKKPKVEPKLTVFDVRPQASATKSKARAERTKQSVTQTSAATPTAPVPPVRPTRPTPAAPGPQLILLDHDQFAAADIGKMPSHPDEGDDGETGSGKGKAAYGPGQGPGGAAVYDVAWYRRPTDAELGGYLPHGAPPGGYALIQCRMIENYHVENCQAIGESPVGSGLGRAMREAAWQFLVRPPRIGNKVKLGTWVRIRIDFTEHPEQ